MEIKGKIERKGEDVKSNDYELLTAVNITLYGNERFKCTGKFHIYNTKYDSSKPKTKKREKITVFARKKN